MYLYSTPRPFLRGERPFNNQIEIPYWVSSTTLSDLQGELLLLPALRQYLAAMPVHECYEPQSLDITASLSPWSMQPAERKKELLL